MIVIAAALALSDPTAQWITPVIAAAGIAGLDPAPRSSESRWLPSPA